MPFPAKLSSAIRSFLLGALALFCACWSAQAWPERTVTIIVPFPAGGPNDLALVQTGAERWPDMPDVPTMTEAGIPNAVIETSQMLLAPAGTPAAILDKLTNATREVLQKPEVQEKMANAGFRINCEGPQELHARMLREIPFWREIVDRAGLAAKQ